MVIPKKRDPCAMFYLGGFVGSMIQLVLWIAILKLICGK